MKWFRYSLFLLLLPCLAYAKTDVLNIYAWTGEIPDFVVRQFENETGIRVNIATYENNEIMYAKLRASKNPGYDIVMPSSYFVDRMRRQGMLEKLDKSKLSNWKNINPAFLHSAFDPTSEYSVPHIWGVTGIFYNSRYYKEKEVLKWSDLWNKHFRDKLMLLDDTREVFSMTLLSLGFSPNDTNPNHLQAAFLKLKKLIPNVKVFSADTVVSIMIDEDATVGMAWNGDAYRAAQENPDVKFVYPQEGFVIWVDNFAIPQFAPHREAAYAFINFILRAEVARDIALAISFPTANLAGQKLLPPAIQNNQTIYPSPETLKRGQFQTDLGDTTLQSYEEYWEILKLMG